jgi:DNA-binding transcriptional LysR family regulator
MTHSPFDRTQKGLLRSSLDEQSLLSGDFWGELRVFLAVAKAKSYNAAAEMLNTSQPTVSRQVKRLQDVMGSQLVVATVNGVNLTPKGAELARRLGELDMSLYALSNELRQENKATEGLVRVSVTDGLNTFFVAPALRRFNERFPRIQIHLKSPINVVDLRENAADLMVGFMPISGADVTVERLGTMHLLPVVSRSYVREYGLPTSGNLAQHAFLQSEFYTARTGLWDDWNKAVAQGRVLAFCDNSFAYGMLVKAGMGIGLLGSYTLAEPDAMPLELGVHVKVPLYGVALTERLQSRPVRLAFEWLSDLFGSSKGWFQDQLITGPTRAEDDDGFRLLFNLPPRSQ